MENKRKLAADMLLITCGKIGTLLINFCTTLLLARMLMPEDYGVVAMCTILMSISSVLVDSGMGGSLIYHKDVNKIEKAGVHITKSKFVDAPIIEEFPLTLECRLVEMAIDSGDFRVVGEVVNMSADESILDKDGNVDFGKLKPISFDSSLNCYRVLGDKVGQAFHDGLKIKNGTDA